MVTALHWVLLVLICLLSLCSVYFSFKSRRSAGMRERGINAALMNVCMGFMLVLIALFFMLAFSGSTLKVIVGALILMLGLFNLFAGLRNHSIYRSMKM